MLERNPNEIRLRKRIRTLFSRAGLNLSPELAQTLEDDFMQLFNDYARAAKGSKGKVYERGERRILHSLRRRLA